ncbi:MAG: hypothetical protein EZS28_000344 [Streblomastix strix]|uniref:Uncharacterized protein n=1 Tax=Streblomastix strix TaxID=222440 RepID=A0A5J4XBD1_9EUKA|nr:MAG: hypothetical protein EZS28_000344 [Streblomastix strix]
MQNINELFEVVVEYVYSDGDSPFLLPISKGEIVEVIQKELKQYTIEKDGVVIKIPSSYLRPYQSESSTDTSYDYNTQSGQSSKAELENKQNDIDNNISTPQSTHILLNSNGLNETKHSDDEHINRNEISHEENQIDVYEQQLSTNQQDTRNVTLEQLQEQIFEIDSLIESDASLQTIFTKFAEVLRGDKLVIIGDESEIADELREFAEKTTNNVIKVIQKNVKTAVDIDACIESGLVSEMVDLSKSAPATGITMKMIELICRNDTEMNSVHVLQALAFLAVNKENHNTIVESGFIYVAVEFIRKEVEGHKVEPEIIKLCLQIFQMLFLYGTITTQQLIHQQIESNTLEILKNIPEYETEAKILESAFSDPVTMENLMKIRRSVENKNYEYLIEIIRSGLLTVLNIGIEQAIDQGSCFEGKLGIIVEIFLCLIRDNKDACKIVIEETYFIERYLGLLNTIKLNIIKPSYLYPLQVPFKNIPIKQQLQLYNKGTIETMSIMIGSLDESVRLIATDIIGNIVISGVEGIKAGQKHPFHERLSSDGTINRLIDIFNDINKEDIHFYIKRILVFLFKAAALPSQIVLYVIKELKQWNDFKEIALLAECEANHDIILKNNYEKLLLQEEFGEWETLNQLVLIHTILRFGKDENKRKVAIANKARIGNLGRKITLF